MARKHFLLLFVFIYIAIATVGFIGAPVAHAQEITASCSRWDFLTNFSECALVSFVSFFAFIATVLIALISWGLFHLGELLVRGGIQMSENIGTGISTDIIADGYDIVLSVANMVLLISIVVIAIGIMLRRESFGTKALIRFFFIALLVNFTMYGAVMAIEGSNAISRVFLDQSSLSPSMFTNITNANYTVSGLENGIPDSVSDNLRGALIAIIGAVFLSIFSLTAAFSMLALGVMVLIRAVALGLLIILLPLAFVTYIFPGLSVGVGGNPFKEWLKHFTRWLLFAPFSLFFLWLAIGMMASMGGGPEGGGSIDLAEGGEVSTFLMSMFASIGILLGGLIIANKMSITGAKYAYGVVEKYGKKGRDWAVGKTQRAITAPLRSEKPEAKEGVKPKRSLNLVRKDRVEKMQKTFGLKTVGRTLSKVAEKSETSILESEKKKLPTDLGRIVQAFPGLSDAGKVAAYSVLQEKGGLDLLKDAHPNAFMDLSKKKAFERFGKGKLKKDVQKSTGLVADAIEDIQAITEGMHPTRVSYLTDHMESILAKQLKDWSANDFSKMSSMILNDWDEKSHFLTKEQHEAYRSAFLRAATKVRPDMARNLKTGAKASGIAAVNKAVEKRIEEFEKKVGMPEYRSDKDRLQWLEEEMSDYLAEGRALYGNRKSLTGGFAPTEEKKP